MYPLVTPLTRSISSSPKDWMQSTSWISRKMLKSKYACMCGVVVSISCYVLNYQQVGEEDGHENEKDHPQYVRDFWKWYWWNVIVWSPGGLMKNIFISHLSCGHGHGFPSGLEHVGERWSLKERVKVVEGHMECEGEHHNKYNRQDHCPNECLEYALKHENIETSVYMGNTYMTL